MATFRLNKLVRDKIVSHQIKDGLQPIYQQLTEAEHKQALIEKLREELSEVEAATHESLAEELADVHQALEDLVKLCKIEPHQIKHHQADKKRKNGSFSKGYFIEKVELAEDNPWTPYYRQKYDQES